MRTASGIPPPDLKYDRTSSDIPEKPYSLCVCESRGGDSIYGYHLVACNKQRQFTLSDNCWLVLWIFKVWAMDVNLLFEVRKCGIILVEEHKSFKNDKIYSLGKRIVIVSDFSTALLYNFLLMLESIYDADEVLLYSIWQNTKNKNIFNLP